MIHQFGGSRQAPPVVSCLFDLKVTNFYRIHNSSETEQCETIRSTVSGSSKVSNSKLEDTIVNGASTVTKSDLSQGVTVNGASSVSESSLSRHVMVTGASAVTKSNLSQHVTVNGASRVSESTLLGDVMVHGAAHVNESIFSQDVKVDGTSHVNRSTLHRAEVKTSTVNGSTLIRSVVEKCNVEDCEIEGCTFISRELKYGVWRDGNLVRKTKENMEPVNREYRSRDGFSRTVMIGDQFFFGGRFHDVSPGNTSVGGSRNSARISGIGQKPVIRSGTPATRRNQRVSSDETSANFLPPPKQTDWSEECDTTIPEDDLDPLDWVIIGEAIITPVRETYDRESITD